MPVFRRFGRPGLLGTVARTAVVAGTATMTARAVNRGINQRDTTRNEAEAYEAEAQQQVPPPPVAQTYSERQTPETPTLADQLQSLSDLHSAGQISDSEFSAAKTRLLTT